MAEEQAADYDQVVQDLTGLLANEAVPVTVVDFQRKDAMLFVPKTKVNMCYIVMTVIFNESNEVLMVQEAKKSCSGLWYLPAGRLEPNESLVEGAKREVKEEAGFECHIPTLLSVHFDGPRWMRFNFFGVVTGGKLKTLAEKDEESLQAGFYNVHSLFNGKVKLRCGDILPVINQALHYKKSLSSVPIHPELLPVLAAHGMLLHRIVLVVDQGSDAGLQMLVSSRGRPHIITAAISPHDSGFFITIQAVIREAILDEMCCLALHGVLGLEHRAKPEHPDGVCVTTLVSLELPPETGLPAVREKSYVWVPITKESHVNTIRRGLEGHLVKCVGRQVQ